MYTCWMHNDPPYAWKCSTGPPTAIARGLSRCIRCWIMMVSFLYSRPLPNAEYARNAVRFERRLELALEGHRFYDLVRWGTAKQVLESYSGFEGKYLSISRNVVFQPQNEYYPIPQDEIDRSGGALKQNTGY